MKLSVLFLIALLMVVSTRGQEMSSVRRVVDAQRKLHRGGNVPTYAPTKEPAKPEPTKYPTYAPTEKPAKAEPTKYPTYEPTEDGRVEPTKEEATPAPSVSETPEPTHERKLHKICLMNPVGTIETDSVVCFLVNFSHLNSDSRAVSSKSEIIC